MSDINRAEVFEKLDPALFKALEGATAFCKLRGNPYVELVHWLHQLLQAQDNDLNAIVRRFELSASALQADIVRALDALPRGAASVTDLSAHIDEAIERAWVFASIKFGATRIRGGHLLIGMLKTPALRRMVLGMSLQFDRVPVDVLVQDFARVLAGSTEGRHDEAAMNGHDAPGDEHALAGAAPLARGNALKQYAVDLTARARAGRIDPVRGRDAEIRQLIDVLMRRRQNNPLLAGEAGVGKTAVVEGFAVKLAAGEVPPSLRDVQLWMLDLGLLQAGAGVKGEFEQRLRALIDAVQASEVPIILFIDEIHTLVGAGGQAGTGDAANLLKPMLARGELRTIGATTWSEYKRYIEKDPALTRRFQVIHVDEPDEARALIMLRGVAAVLQKHHGVLLLDEAIEAAVSLSHRYIPARQLPDKAVALLDTACARVAISQHGVPAAVEDARSRIAYLQTESDILARERDLGIADGEAIDRVRHELDASRARLAAFEAQWAQERDLASEIIALRAQLVDDGATEPTRSDAAGAEPPATSHGGQAGAAAKDDGVAQRTDVLQRLKAAQEALSALQQEHPLIQASVDAQAVAAVVADWTGIPLGRMVADRMQAVLDLVQTLEGRVIGQSGALHAIAQRVQTATARLDDPDKPVGVFLLCGPSGVGKTETALALAEALYGGEQNMVSLNMSEFQEPHTVSTLKGAPPGYVGFGEGGVLTEAVRRRPYSVVLLDEIEKAHPDVHELFFQVFDKGWMEDGEGRYIDFRNTLILLTSNVGTDLLADLFRDPDLAPAYEGLAPALRVPLLKVFPPALLGRMTVVPYLPLDDATLSGIVTLQVDRIRQRMLDNHGVEMTWSEAAIDLIRARCTETASGARNVGAILTASVLPAISRQWLTSSINGQPLQRVALQVVNGEFDYVFA